MALDVTFTDDIPKIEREGFTRQSKYTPLLDACVERPGKAARLTVESQGQASSRASSIKDAAEKHDSIEKGYFVVATRSGDSDDEYHVFVKYNEGEAPEDVTGAIGLGADTEDEEKTSKPKAKAKTKAKAKKKAA